MRRILVVLCLVAAAAPALSQGDSASGTLIRHRDVIPHETYVVFTRGSLVDAVATLETARRSSPPPERREVASLADGRILVFRGKESAQVGRSSAALLDGRSDLEYLLEQAPVLRSAALGAVQRRTKPCPEKTGDTGTSGAEGAAGEKESTPREVVVYVFDTRASRDDLDFVERDRLPPGTDPHGHGTLVANEIRAPETRLDIVSVRVLDRHGEGSPLWLGHALQKVVELERGKSRPVVCNMSFSSENSAAVTTLIRWFMERVPKAIVVTAAGNTCGGDSCGRSPGNIATVVNVGALFDDGNVDPRSATGECVDVRASGELHGARWVVAGTSISAARLTREIAALLAVARDTFTVEDPEVCKLPESSKANTAHVALRTRDKGLQSDGTRPGGMALDVPSPRWWWGTLSAPVLQHTGEGNDVPFGPADLVVLRHPQLGLDVVSSGFGRTWRFAGSARLTSLGDVVDSHHGLVAGSAVHENQGTQWGVELSESWYVDERQPTFSDTTLVTGLGWFPRTRTCWQSFVSLTARATRSADHQFGGFTVLDRSGYGYGTELRFAVEDFRKQDEHALGPLFYAPLAPRRTYADVSLGYDWETPTGEAFRAHGPHARAMFSFPLSQRLHLEPAGFIARHTYDRELPPELAALDPALRPGQEWSAAVALRWTYESSQLAVDVTASVATEDFGLAGVDRHTTYQLVLTARQRTAGTVLRGQTGSGATVTTIGNGSTSRPRPTPILH